jgi:hypothetical protein
LPCCARPQTCFTLHFNSGKLWGSDRLTLCFDNAEVAATWHSKMTAVITGQLTQRSVYPDDVPSPSKAPGSVFGPESPSRQLLAEMVAEEGEAGGCGHWRAGAAARLSRIATDGPVGGARAAAAASE